MALYNGGYADYLAAQEIDLVADAVGQFDDALQASPALRVIAADIVESADEFSSLWDADVILQSRIDEAFGDRDVATLPSRTESDRDDRAAKRGNLRRIDRSGSAGRHSRRTSTGRWAVRSAIGLALFVFAFVLMQVLQRDRGARTVETREGEVTIVELSEGSHIRLLGGSKLSFTDPESGSPLFRQALLEGSAYFDIAPEERGFIVKTSNARVTVLGTTFGMNSRDRITEVVLTEGRLTLSSEAQLERFVLLEPGQMSRVTADGSPIDPVDVDISEHLAWTGLFIFKSTPLSTVVRHLTGHFDVPITVEAPLNDERVTGTFEQNQPVETILDVLADAVGGSVEIDPSGSYALTHP
jgi:ferric-dicitrate binding protein FerR (iron transport regulator)